MGVGVGVGVAVAVAVGVGVLIGGTVGVLTGGTVGVGVGIAVDLLRRRDISATVSLGRTIEPNCSAIEGIFQ